MPVPTSLSLASIIIGFISFSVTLTLLLGVYRDLISTLRKADTNIPIILGNLRQEIIFERALISHKLVVGDEFNVFPRKLRYLRTGATGKREKYGVRQKFAELLEATIQDLWIDFKRLERPFLIRSGLRAEEVRKGGYWSSDDVREKPSRRGRRRSRKGEVESEAELRRAEEGIRQQGRQYYNTDIGHRFIWWQCKDEVGRLADQIQRIQIRRMESDLYETDELVKRLIRRGDDGDNGGYGGGSGSSSGSDGRRRSNVRSRVASRAGSVRSVRVPSRRGSAVGGNFREVEEREVVRRTAASPGRVRQSEMKASNTSKRRERRDGPRTEYEVLRPGSAYVERVERPRSNYGNDRERRDMGRRLSYSRERGRD